MGYERHARRPEDLLRGRLPRVAERSVPRMEAGQRVQSEARRPDEHDEHDEHDEARRPMTADEIVALSKAHTLFEWSAQEKVDPLAVTRAKGVYFWTADGRRFLDFNSQLMCVNIGH